LLAVATSAWFLIRRMENPRNAARVDPRQMAGGLLGRRA
jgi:hypothetical protein